MKLTEMALKSEQRTLFGDKKLDPKAGTGVTISAAALAHEADVYGKCPLGGSPSRY